MGPAAAANRLLRHQLHDMAGHLLTLTERAYLMTQDIGGTERSVYGRRDEPHTTRVAVDDGRGDTYWRMPTVGLHTYRGAVDATTWEERELADARAQQENLGLNQHQRRSQPYPEVGPFGGNRTPKRSRTERETTYAPTGKTKPRGKPCVICGRAHLVSGCPWKRDHCFRCGKPGQLRASCPQRSMTSFSSTVA